ncbi:MAG: fibrobacter succinogenes major paralogous domain-containing protein [Bacteroidales bacterium]|nr:fibrobacter succinogenes major paralogous domain-containing protein [Bacteroidales bacterium]
MKKITLILILIATFATKSFASYPCPTPSWCPSADLHQTLCLPLDQIDPIEFPSVMGRTLFLEWWKDDTRSVSVNTPDGISVSGTTTDFREYGHPVAISGRPVDPGTHLYTVSDACGRILLSGSITLGTPIEFTIQPDTHSLVVPQGVDFCPDTLSVTLTGSAPITLQWYYTTAPDTITGRTAFGSPITVPAGVNLQSVPIVSDILPNDKLGTRYYYVSATNICGTVRSDISGMREVVASPYPTGCNFVATGRNNVTITSASFATDSVWTIPGTGGRPTQVWSDAVVSDQCEPRGDSYNGGSDPNFNVDCRASTNGSGVHYFSWCAVMKHAAILCPSPWRVPTQQDFIDLDILLGGTGENRSVGSGENGFTGTGTNQKYTGTGAGNWGGSRWTALSSPLSGANSSYWSSSENIATLAFTLRYDASAVRPQFNGSKNTGFALRCVKDN